MLRGRRLDKDTIAEAAHNAARIATPVDNTYLVAGWRKRMAEAFVRFALRELKGDDLSRERELYLNVAL